MQDDGHNYHDTINIDTDNILTAIDENTPIVFEVTFFLNDSFKFQLYTY